LQPFGKQLVAGDTWDWFLSPAGYSPATHTLKYFFNGRQNLLLTGIADPNNGGQYEVKALPADTSKLTPGMYRWQLVVFKISDNSRTELNRGIVEVLPDIASAPAGVVETRSYVKITLDNLRANIQGRASRVEAEYMYGGRQMRLLSMKELMVAEAIFASRYEDELVESGELPPDNGVVRMGFGDASDSRLSQFWRNFPGSQG
jgi:hypothetical protein